jgi:hypothetical protein
LWFPECRFDSYLTDERKVMKWIEIMTTPNGGSKMRRKM